MKIQKSAYRFLYHSTIDLDFSLEEKKEIKAYSNRTNLEYLSFNSEDDYIIGISNILNYHFENDKGILYSNLLQGFLNYLIVRVTSKSAGYFDSLLVINNNLVIRSYDIHRHGKQLIHRDLIVKEGVY